MHKHRCGFSLFNYSKGCGHVWSHDESCRGSESQHTCPKCGLGPWYTRYDGSDRPDEEPSSGDVTSLAVAMVVFCAALSLLGWLTR